ncbi:hypothetical protein [Corynebacterium sp.]|uniref:hypothetical protein n=1 Tax=Corynebacterium sp. TaxID=1720 RepID=UPI0026DB74F7|nr:hypothetical protein [Corynebacterium sp.]MDO5032825.1 hypothetical protein [Corynebacterium sp.]
MKKFTRFAAAGLVFSAGLTLAACHPPSQQDSTEKVNTGATYTGTAPGAGASESEMAEDSEMMGEDTMGTAAATATAAVEGAETAETAAATAVTAVQQ